MIGVPWEDAGTMPDDLEQLIIAAKHVEVSLEERESQRRSFAYGNTHFENPNVSKATIDHAAELLKSSDAENGRTTR
jgi:hypothetical protein